MGKENRFFQLLKLAVGTGSAPETPLSAQEWIEVLELAEKQKLTGVLLEAAEVLPAASKPPRPLLMQWIGRTHQIERVNQAINKEAVRVSEFFARKGMRSMILKGQGVAQLYPHPLRRMPGDIDIWLEGSRKEIIRLARETDPKAEVVYHHVDMELSKVCEVEVHTTPSWMFNPLTNYRLQALCRQWKRNGFGQETTLEGTDGSVRVPEGEMNRVFLVLHAYRHLLSEGVGLRQLMDIFYVFRQETSPEERARTARQWRALRMTDFAAAVMWVLETIFGLERKYMPVSPSERRGRRLLEEIMRAGNFGQFDPRLSRERMQTDGGRFSTSLKRMWGFVHDYPQEVCWAPFFKIWHYGWRKMKN